jgi:hypothetical protein
MSEVATKSQPSSKPCCAVRLRCPSRAFCSRCPIRPNGGAGESAADDYPPGDGFLQLSHQGCGVFDVLVVTGERRGSVWAYDNVGFPCSHGATL